MGRIITGECRTNLVGSLQVHGRLVKQEDWGAIWVQDGKVWLVDAYQAEDKGSWADYCKKNRNPLNPEPMIVVGFAGGCMEYRIVNTGLSVTVETWALQQPTPDEDRTIYRKDEAATKRFKNAAAAWKWIGTELQMMR